MSFTIRLILAVTMCTLVSTELAATHNRAGEITYVQIGPLTIEATITTYTKTSSASADRDSLIINWGDGNSDLIFRTNGRGEELPGEDIKINYYTGRHTYPGINSYTLSFQDPNRVNNILNVNFPFSVDIPFYIETTFKLVESQFQGPNNSIILLQPPIDFACVGKPFLHNPNAFDIDGDSIAYALITPLQGEGDEVPKYQLPDQILPSPENIMRINETTGDLTWITPQSAGEYNVAILIKEYRDGLLLNSVTRDMQILVQDCDDNPPEVIVQEEICVIAGTKIVIPVTVRDEDPGQNVRISATGGPFIQNFSPAILEQENIYSPAPLTTNFIWETKCEHATDNPYRVVFRGQDDSRLGVSGNAVLKTLQIRVVAPPVENLAATTTITENITLTWDSPYACEETIDDYFIGFRVYRKQNSNPFVIDTCTNGLEGRGYQVINSLTAEKSGNSYFYIDQTTEKGKIYCYRVVALFATRSNTNQIFNIIESLTSQEVCLQLNQDIPLITEVSVVETDRTNGAISISWQGPNPVVIDSELYPGPYGFHLLRSTQGAAYIKIAEETSAILNPQFTFNYTDTEINTIDDSHNYRVDLFSGTTDISVSPEASSVFSTIVSTDRTNQISCSETVPWINYNYQLEIQQGASQIQFDFLDESALCNFMHTELINSEEYCYRIRTIGAYGLPETPDTLINLSQIICGVPVDTVGPCAPILEVSNPCDDLVTGATITDFQNTLTWVSSNIICENSDDVSVYRIYYRANLESDLQLLIELPASEPNVFEHLPDNNLGGCYQISALDNIGNEGPLSDPSCVENCPIYRLPNTFTPNNDGSNDFFIPLENRFVESVDFKVFNRWGNVVYETNNPALDWDGTNLSGTKLNGGTYYYVCSVFEFSNPTPFSQLSGYIQIIK